MGTKANPSKFDCYSKAADDEPMFILLARDKHMVTLVWLWTVLREIDGELPEVVEEARACALQALEYAADNRRQVVGLSQSVLAGVLELARCANYAVDNAKNQETGISVMRKILSKTTFENVQTT